MQFSENLFLWGNYEMIPSDMSINNHPQAMMQVNPSSTIMFYWIPQRTPQNGLEALNTTTSQSPQAEPNIKVEAVQRPQTSPYALRKKKIQEKKKEQSSRKNSQSNIVNHLFSYLSHLERSQKLVLKAIQLLKRFSYDQVILIKNVFYNIVKLMNMKKGRRYVNRDIIMSYYTPENFKKSIPEIETKLFEIGLITLEELCFLFRVCTNAFLKEISIPALLTSKRVLMIAKKEHLKRRRLILAGTQKGLRQ